MTSVYDGIKREIDDLKAEIERLNDARARDAALIDDLAARDKASLTEIARLNTWINLHRGDTLSLDIEVNTMRDHWLDAEALWQSAEKTIVNLTDVVLDITRQRDVAEAEVAQLKAALTRISVHGNGGLDGSNHDATELTAKGHLECRIMAMMALGHGGEA